MEISEIIMDRSIRELFLVQKYKNVQKGENIAIFVSKLHLIDILRI